MMCPIKWTELRNVVKILFGLRKCVEMKKTISAINKQIFWHKLSLLWYYVRFALLCVYVLFIFFAPFAIGICIERMGETMAFLFGWVKWLCYPMYLYNFYALDKNSFIREEYEKIALRKNKAQDIIYNKKQLKVLFKKSVSEKLDYCECSELCDILNSIGVDANLEDTVEEFGSDRAKEILYQ